MNVTEEILAIFLAEEEKAAGPSAAAYLEQVMRDPILNKIAHKQFPQDIALQIRARYEKKDWDYVTPMGSVISGVVFEEHKGPHEQEPEKDLRGRKDLPLMALSEITGETMVRPKLPGYLMTRQDVRAMGRSTCYELVERVGDTLYGLYPLVQCGCCLYNTPVRKDQYVPQPWHEGLMVFLNGIEYRTRHNEVCDKPYMGVIWEHEKIDGSWIPTKPRGINKQAQKEKHQIITPMLFSKVQEEQPKVRWMSKAIVLGRDGFVFTLQSSGWDMIGGKQEIMDKTPYETMKREYYEELGKDMPEPTYLGVKAGPSFDIHMYYVMDRSLKSNHAEWQLEGFQYETWKEAFQLYKRSNVHVPQSKRHRSRVDKQYEHAMNKMLSSTRIVTKRNLHLPLVSYYTGGMKMYLVPSEKMPQTTWTTEEELDAILEACFGPDRSHFIRYGRKRLEFDFPVNEIQEVQTLIAELMKTYPVWSAVYAQLATINVLKEQNHVVLRGNFGQLVYMRGISLKDQLLPYLYEEDKEFINSFHAFFEHWTVEERDLALDGKW